MALIVEQHYSDVEIAECSRLYNVIVRGHDDCAGTGMRVVDSGVIDCECEAVYKYIKQLIYSRLPRRFWGVDSWVHTVDVSEHSMFSKWLMPDVRGSCVLSGTGKTSLMTLIGKAGIWQGQRVFYLTSENLLEYRRKDSENKIFLDRLAGADIVLLDNLTQYHKSEWATGQIEYCLRNLHDDGTHIIIASSHSLSELDRLTSQGLASFIEKLELELVIEYTGKGDLEVGSYLSHPILDEAAEHFQSRLFIA